MERGYTVLLHHSETGEDKEVHFFARSKRAVEDLVAMHWSHEWLIVSIKKSGEDD
jgi:hypothetical protein